jgi:Glucose-6-phosphate 1-dehydrogenase
VPEDSGTETFAALRLDVANWRWQGVPFFLRAGKRLPRKLTQIAVRFQSAPVSLFQADGAPCVPQTANCEAPPNELLITLQPDEGFDLRFEVKAPGSSENGTMTLETQHLSFSYEDAFGPVPDAYETLLRDIIVGDPTLFVRGDEVEASWQLYAPILEADAPAHPYEAGPGAPTRWTDCFLPGAPRAASGPPAPRRAPTCSRPAHVPWHGPALFSSGRPSHAFRRPTPAVGHEAHE